MANKDFIARIQRGEIPFEEIKQFIDTQLAKAQEALAEFRTYVKGANESN